jgi:hypothetical protein
VRNISKEARHLLRSLAISLSILEKPKSRLMEGAFLSDAGKCVLKRFSLGNMVVHVVGRYGRDV